MELQGVTFVHVRLPTFSRGFFIMILVRCRTVAASAHLLMPHLRKVLGMRLTSNSSCRASCQHSIQRSQITYLCLSLRTLSHAIQRLGRKCCTIFDRSCPSVLRVKVTYSNKVSKSYACHVSTSLGRPDGRIRQHGSRLTALHFSHTISRHSHHNHHEVAH